MSSPWRATLVLIAGGCMMVLGLPQPLASHGSPGERTVASAIPPGPTYWVSARHDNPHIMLGAVAVRRDRDLLTFGGAGGWCFTGVRSANGWFSGASATTDGLRFFQIRFRIHRDVLVQNGHADGDYKVVTDSDPEDWRRIMEVNLFGALHLVQAVVPSMKARGDGRIVLMNSGASTDPPPTLGAYSASKAALASLVRTIAVELGPHGIRANGIQLGPMTGDNFRGYLENLAREAGRTYEEELALYNEQFALRYTPTPEECAGTALFLASDLARPITGQSIAVNGGKWFLT